MNLDKLRDQVADAEAEAQRADKAFKVSPDPKTHQSKVISAQLAENAREALATAEQRARDAERAVKLEQLAKLKQGASVPTLLKACSDDVAAIVNAEQLIRDAVTRMADRVNAHNDTLGAAYQLANEIGAPIGDLEAKAQQIKMVDIFELQAEVQRALRAKHTGDGRGSGFSVGRAVGSVDSLRDWLVF
jgi:hypothetical protein